MNFIDKCNGIHHGGADLSFEAKVAIAKVFPEALRLFTEYIQPDEGPSISHWRKLMIGTRCDLQGVYERLQGFDVLGYHSVYGSPLDWALDALRDCASADYYYRFEKNWD